MALCNIHWFSETIKKEVGTTILLPDAGKPPFATLYLLHGLSDDHTTWQRRTRLEVYLSRLPLIVVMPDGFRGFYTNNAAGPAYTTYLAEELPRFIERNFPAKRSRSARGVGGLSMGGYGALRLALGYPDRYVSAHSHSGALRLDKRLRDIVGLGTYRQIFGGPAQRPEHDLLLLAKAAKRSGRVPSLRIDCGTEDRLLDSNRHFHQELDRLNITHEYEEFPGFHNWDYWDRHIRSAIDFHMKAMNINAVD
jgi:putative tributyrin esterase